MKKYRFYSFIKVRAKKIYKSRLFLPFLIVLGFFLAVMAVIYIGTTPFASRLDEGDIALRTIYAPYDFTYPTTVDEESTDKARKEFEEKISPVYDIDNSIMDAALLDIDAPFAALLESKKYDDPEALKKIAKDSLEGVFIVGIMDPKEKSYLAGSGIKELVLRNPRFKIERTIRTKDALDTKEAAKVLYDSVDRVLSKQRSERKVVYDLARREIVANASFNEEETAKRKKEARSQVPVIYNRLTVKKNELIAEKGARITKEHITKLNQIGLIKFAANKALYMIGLLILFAELVAVMAIYLLRFERKIIQEPKNVFLIGMSLFFGIVLSLAIIQAQQSLYLIPLASIGMMLALLLNANVAFSVVLALGVYIGFLSNGRIDLTLILFVGSAMGIYAVRDARRRSKIFLAGFVVAAVNLISIAAIGLINNTGREVILREGIFGLASGIISSFIVIGLLPVFEYTFNLVTNITLLELSDLGNPLLKELTIKAPGTYQHSMLVGNLAEEACGAIGANALLARVGSYYHDIGKIEKAEYFVENRMSSPSRHEGLSPSMSALIITNHVKDGIELARKYKLNKAIVNFIIQHHGSSIIYYFYQKALEKAKHDDELKEEEFRYHGPRAQSKEVAIVLLADAVEASSRMLSDPTPARIKGLVQKIINNKFIDGQLDDCDLTLKDLNKISESFMRVLTAVFHTRLEYPDSRIKKEKKNGLKNRSKQSQ